MYGFRWFVVDQNDEIKKIPYSNYQKFIDGKYAFPDAKGSKLNSVVVVLELNDRKPVRLIRSEFTRMALVPGGFYATDSYIEEAGLIYKSQDNKLIANYVNNSLRWKPTPEQVEFIMGCIFSSDAKPKAPKRKLKLIKPK